MSCWIQIYPAFANSVDPDQLASSEANWSGSALFVIQYVKLYQQPGSSNLIGWKLEEGLVCSFHVTEVRQDSVKAYTNNEFPWFKLHAQSPYTWTFTKLSFN